MPISHIKSNTIADFTGTITGYNSQGSTITIAASDLVRPSDWNSVHNFYQTLSGNTSNSSNLSGTNLVFQGGNNITLSGTTAAGAATVVISGPNIPAQTQQPMYYSASGTSTSANTIAFGNTNGISFSLSNGSVVGTVKTDYQSSNANYLTSQSNQALSGSNGSFTFQTVTFGNSNGLSFYSTNGSFVGSYTVPNVPAQTNQTLGLYATSNTTQSSSGTVDARSITFAGAGIASVGITGNSVVVSVPSGGGGDGVNALVVNAGATTASTTLSLSNSNNVSFGHNAGVITASASFNQSVQPVAVSGSNGSFAFSTVTFGNSNGASFYSTNGSMVVSYTVPSQSVQPVALSGSNGSFNFSTATFGNSNGMSFYTTNGSMVGSYTVPSVPAQTNQTLGIYASSGTMGTSSSTYDARSLTIVGSGAASVGWSNGSFIVSAPNAAAGNVTFSAGTASAGLASLVFSNSNNISFGLNGSTITASASGGGGGIALANSQTTYTSGTAHLSGAGAITIASTTGQSYQISVPATSSLSATGAVSISTNGSTISIGAPLNLNSQRFGWPPGNFTAVAALGNGSFSINRMQAEGSITATRMEVPFLVSIASSATANTWGFACTAFGGIYTKNVSTLSSLSSGSVSFSISLASNTAGSTHVIAHAIRAITIPINVNMTPGEYFVGFGISTATSSIGTATTALGNTWSVMGGPVYSSAVPQVTHFNATTNTSTGLWGGQGVYSAAISTVPPAVSLSAINQTGSYYARGNFGFILRNLA